MDLAEWFWRTKTPKQKMADDIGIHLQTVFIMIKKYRTPSLFTALAIEKYTKGKVKLEDLLKADDLKRLKVVKGFSGSIDESIQN